MNKETGLKVLSTLQRVIIAKSEASDKDKKTLSKKLSDMKVRFKRGYKPEHGTAVQTVIKAQLPAIGKALNGTLSSDETEKVFERIYYAVVSGQKGKSLDSFITDSAMKVAVKNTPNKDTFVKALSTYHGRAIVDAKGKSKDEKKAYSKKFSDKKNRFKKAYKTSFNVELQAVVAKQPATAGETGFDAIYGVILGENGGSKMDTFATMSSLKDALGL